ncbi:MAG: GNAT family N-acetyltransferase [Chloroflexota bacterium]
MQPTQDQIKEFVLAAHADLGKVQSLLETEPSLLNERYIEFNETALEAASHMGHRPIAEHLLAKGAPLTICAAAMLGHIDDVAEFLDRGPNLVHAQGAHGIPLIYHAALSGNTDITALLLALGGGEGIEDTLHAAVKFGHIEMTRWLLNHGAKANVKDFQGRTPIQVANEKGLSEIAELINNVITLRVATADDIPAIQSMGRKSRQVAYVDTGLMAAEENAKTLEGAWSVEALTTSITTPRNHAIVAIDGEQIIGYLSGRYKEPQDEGQVRLYRIYLDPDYWGQQIGYRMWQSYRQALTQDVKRIDVGVFVGNERATRFYQRIGFRIMGTEDGTHRLQMWLG